MNVIGGINIVKILISQGSNDLSVLRNIGTCELKSVKNPNDLEQLLDYYLVWYKTNAVGKSGWYIDDSINYRLYEYVEGLVNGSIKMLPEVSSLIQSFTKALEKPVEILVAFDTYLSKGLIIDGTKRVLALHYLKHSNPDVLEKLFSSIQSIHIFQLNSNHCKILFPCDFLKLCLKNPVGKN